MIYRVTFIPSPAPDANPPPRELIASNRPLPGNYPADDRKNGSARTEQKGSTSGIQTRQKPDSEMFFARKTRDFLKAETPQKPLISLVIFEVVPRLGLEPRTN